MRKSFGVVIMLCFILCNAFPTYAATYADTPTVYMEYISNASGTIYIDASGTATIKVAVNGYQNATTKVVASVNLQQFKNGSWETIKSFPASSASHRLSFTQTYQVNKGYSYRVLANITAYSGTNSDSQTVTSSEARY